MGVAVLKWLSAATVFCASIMATIQAAPQDEGSWSPVVDWPIVAIHSVLTPEGKVMNFGTDENGVQGAQFLFDVWDPQLGTGAGSHNTLPNTLGVDSFCSGAVVLPESGNILMSGGDNRTNGGINRGINDAVIYDNQSNNLNPASPMSFARWYPTSTVLANGEIFINGGIDGAGRNVTTPEIYTPSTNEWRSLFGISTEDHGFAYPRQWLAPNGKVFGYSSYKNMYYMDTNGNGSIQDLGRLTTEGGPYQSAAVMYQPGKILQVGGVGNITNDAVVIDINGAAPSVRSVTKPTQVGRIWVESVVLPNGKVMIVGGSAEDNELEGTSFRPEIWDPATEAWTSMEAAVRARLYHSTALLLKDGRVMVAGGGTPGPQTNTNAEIFSPPYLYNSVGELASRPTIVSAPAEAPYGSKVAVRHDPNNIISRVTLIKTGATTHSNNMEQRFIELDFKDIHRGVSVTLPSSPDLAPPGYYLLHLLDNKGVPSEAHIIRISSTAELVIGPYPVARPDTITTTSQASITIDVLANDTANGKGLVGVNRYSQQGNTQRIVDNKIVFEPLAGFIGTDSFWYVMEDDQGRTNASKVTVMLSTYPTAADDNVNVFGNQSITIDVLANDIGNGLVLAAPSAWSWKGGTVSLSNNKLIYKAKAGFTGLDKIWYLFSDSQGRSNSGQVNITVTADIFPVANNDNYITPRNITKTLDVLANDIAAGIAIDSLYAYTAQGGTTSRVNGQVLYTPKTDFTGEDNFWYVIIDSQGRRNSAQVKINVTP